MAQMKSNSVTATAVTPGVYGSGRLIPVIVVDERGQVQFIQQVAKEREINFPGDPSIVMLGNGSFGPTPNADDADLKLYMLMGA
jgi:hypothetical protein